jgi:hypothetical protein
MRLETKDGIILAEIELPASKEARRDRIQRPRVHSSTDAPATPPKKNDPECYFEATAVHFTPLEEPAKSDKVTEAPATGAITRSGFEDPDPL